MQHGREQVETAPREPSLCQKLCSMDLQLSPSTRVGLGASQGSCSGASEASANGLQPAFTFSRSLTHPPTDAHQTHRHTPCARTADASCSLLARCYRRTAPHRTVPSHAGGVLCSHISASLR